MADQNQGPMPDPFKTNPGRAAEPAPAIPRHMTPEHGAEQAREIQRQVREGTRRNHAPDLEPKRGA